MDLDKALKVFDVTDIESLDLKSLKTLYRNLAKEHHPDQGGQAENFVELKDAYTLLQEELKGNNSQGKNLKILSKEEILDKYYKDTTELQVRLDSFQLSFEAQNETLTQVKHRIQNLSKDFERRKQDLQKELESRISKLEKGYTQNLIQKILFFLPKMSEDEFWHKYRSLVDQFSKKHSELDTEFFKQMLEIYGDGLNAISKVVKKF